MESISIRVLLADDEAAIRNGLQNAIPWDQKPVPDPDRFQSMEELSFLYSNS